MDPNKQTIIDMAPTSVKIVVGIAILVALAWYLHTLKRV